jgi:hypothetical protein
VIGSPLFCFALFTLLLCAYPPHLTSVRFRSNDLLCDFIRDFVEQLAQETGAVAATTASKAVTPELVSLFARGRKLIPPIEVLHESDTPGKTTVDEQPTSILLHRELLVDPHSTSSE